MAATLADLAVNGDTDAALSNIVMLSNLASSIGGKGMNTSFLLFYTF